MSGLPIDNLLHSAGYNMSDMCSVVPDLMQMLARSVPLSYDDFVSQINKDLNNIISITESGRQHHWEKGEDAITEHIIVQLKQKYPSVHHDAQHGGHCDIYIEVTGSSGELYKWIMEAKLWDGFDYVYKGLEEQLLGSYAIGGMNNCKGGMIFYSKLTSGVSYAMEQWYEGLKAKGIALSDKRQDGLRFCTEHKLNSGSGANFFVGHYCIDLYHAPTKAKYENAAEKNKQKILKEAKASKK